MSFKSGFESRERVAV